MMLVLVVALYDLECPKLTEHSRLTFTQGKSF